ncbi:MAG: NAD-dependent epimerase/dehydratase family protein [Acidimicrobiales bacterium]
MRAEWKSKEIKHPLALVTGATGYIGRRLVSALSAAGWPIRASGRRGRPANSPPGAEYVPADLAAADHATLARLVDGVGVVFHLAGASSSKSSETEMMRANVDGTRRLLDALPAGVERFVHMSSTSVYGESSPLPTPVVEASAGEPSRSYGVAKWGAEQCVWAAGRRGLEVVVLRPVTVFGPGSVKLMASAVLDTAIEHRLGLDSLVAPSPVIEQRLVHIDDLLAATMHLATHPGAAGQAFNVANLYPTSDDVVRALAGAFGMEAAGGFGEVDAGLPEAGPSPEERRKAYGEMRAAGMTDDILFTPERFRFMRKANLNNRLAGAALAATGFEFSHTDLDRSVISTLDAYRRNNWIV